MQKTTIFLTLLLAILSGGINAQIVDNLPVIRTGSEDDKPIELKRLKIDVFVIENIATTTFEMQFYNNNNRVMEGELNFPLDNGVAVSGFALDVKPSTLYFKQNRQRHLLSPSPPILLLQKKRK